MIKPEMIPDEVVEAADEAFDEAYAGLELLTQKEWVKSAIAAALNAWPDGCVGESECGWHRYIELPLPQEKSDE